MLNSMAIVYIRWLLVKAVRFALLVTNLKNWKKVYIQWGLERVGRVTVNIFFFSPEQ